MNLPNKLTLTRILLVPLFMIFVSLGQYITCLLYTSPSPRDQVRSRMPSSA